MKKAKCVYPTVLLIVLSLISYESVIAQVPPRDYFNFVFENNFNDDVLGRYTVSDYNADFSPQPTSLPEANRMDIIQESNPKYEKFMRGYFPQGTLLPDQHGYLFMSYLKNPVTELYFSYDVRFKEGFQWVKGGKIPGLTGGKIVTGVIPSTTDGWSARPVWQTDGKLWFYVYHQDQDYIYGTMYEWGDFKFQSGIWYNITIRVVLNTFVNNVPQNDGVLEGFINGQLYFQRKGFKFVSLQNIKIDNMYICSFFGGNTPDWATTRDEWVDTDNYVAYVYSNSAPSVVRGNVLTQTGKTLLHPYLAQGTQVPEVPLAPSGLKYTLLSKSSTTLVWTDNSNNESGFRLYRSLSATDGFSEIATLGANVTTYTDNSLQPGTNYYYKLIAYNQNGNSSATPVYMITTTLLDLPSAPSQFTSTGQTSSTISLSWKDNSSREQGFHLFRSTSETDGFVQAVSCAANETSCTDRTLKPATSYYYKLRAYNADGYSEFTPVLKVTTQYSGDETMKTIHIDPENINDPLQDGSVYHPYDSWKDIQWKEGFTYLQKRGTTFTTDALQVGANHITIGAYGEGDLPVIQSETTTYLISGFEKSGIHIKELNLKADNSVSCIYFLGSTHDSIIVERCLINGSSGGIRIVDATNLVLRYNKIIASDEAVSSTAANNDIYYNVFSNCIQAINIMSSSSTARIFNNVFSDNMKSVAVTYADLILYNNIFYMPKEGQVAINQSAGQITSDNNIYHPARKGFVTSNSKSYDNLDEIQKQLKVDLKSFTSDPLFEDLLKHNYMVHAESPAVNNGRDLNLKSDIDGNRVPVFEKADIGAYEYNGNLLQKKYVEDPSAEMNVYPNPSQGRVMITAELSDSALLETDPFVSMNEITVFDVTGKAVFSKRISNYTSSIQEDIDLSEKGNGLYFVVLKIADMVLKEKLMISRPN